MADGKNKIPDDETVSWKAAVVLWTPTLHCRLHNRCCVNAEMFFTGFCVMERLITAYKLSVLLIYPPCFFCCDLDLHQNWISGLATLRGSTNTCGAKANLCERAASQKIKVSENSSGLAWMDLKGWRFFFFFLISADSFIPVTSLLMYILNGLSVSAQQRSRGVHQKVFPPFNPCDEPKLVSRWCNFKYLQAMWPSSWSVT